MKATRGLHEEMGQNLCLDNITHGLLTSGTLRRNTQEFWVTGLTSRGAVLRAGTGGPETGRRSVPAGSRSDERRGGWVSLEVSPLLANDTAGTVTAVRELHDRAGRPNRFIKIPGTREGLPAIEEVTFAGVPINVTLLFSRGHYVAAASLFVSRWDVAVMGKTPDALRDRLGIAIAKRTYTAPLTINTIPESTLKALADHDQLGAVMPAHGGDCEEILAEFTRAGIDIDALAGCLQEDGAISFAQSWDELMKSIASRGEATKVAG